MELETDEKSLSDAPNGNNDALIWLKTVSSSNVDNLEKVSSGLTVKSCCIHRVYHVKPARSGARETISP